VVFALEGAEVRLFDSDRKSLEGAPARIRNSLEDMQRAGLADAIDAASDRLVVCDSLADAVVGVEYVQESAFERVDVKTAVANEIGAAITPGTVVGSSSSGIPASAFTEHAPNRERFLVAHPVNPPHLVPLVELVPAPWTDPQILPWLRAKLEAVGQVPIHVRREIDGFVLNRLQGALLNEAWALYEEGYASLADIDATVSRGLGLRWAFMGPFETIDLNAPGGVEDYAQRLRGLYHGIAKSRAEPRGWSDALIGKVTTERRAALPLADLPKRSRWRDRRLMQLVAHLRAARSSD
jgi:3-hydroxyacyl-CoA dehydrogenase